MGRENNGVKSKIYNDVGRGSENRGSGQAGKMGEEGGLKPVGAEVNPHARTMDMSKGRSAEGSHIQAGRGTVKDMGGVGNYGMDDQRQDFFKEKH
jgi:hypothetical protein